MPVKYLALLRGINVGGNNVIKMNDLKKTFEEVGFSGIQTYIQSGNVIFYGGENNKAKLSRKIEQTLSKKYGYDARIALLTFAELQQIIVEIPAGYGEQPDEFRCDVWFLREPVTPNDVMRVVKIREGVDWVFAGGKVVYTSRLNAQATKSYLPKIIQTPVYQSITVRGLKVAKKLFELMGDAGACSDNN